MKTKHRILIGTVICLGLLVGYSTTPYSTNKKEQGTLKEGGEVKEVNQEIAVEKKEVEEVTEKAETEATTEPKVSQEQVVTTQVTTLASFIGKKAEEVDKVLGKPSSCKKIEDSELIAANYYKVDFNDEVAKVEVDFDVDTQKVNYISFTIIDATNIIKTKEAFINALTTLHGESTIERYVNVKGKQRRDWNDGKLDYDLKYYEDNISLDIYPLDEYKSSL